MSAVVFQRRCKVLASCHPEPYSAKDLAGHAMPDPSRVRSRMTATSSRSGRYGVKEKLTAEGKISDRPIHASKSESVESVLKRMERWEDGSAAAARLPRISTLNRPIARPS